MDKPIVTGTREDAMTDPRTGQYIKSIKVTFRVGDAGPFTVDIPKTEFTAARVNDEMARVAGEIAQLPRG